MKKIVIMVLIVTLVFTLFSCGEEPKCENCSGSGEVYRSCLNIEIGRYVLAQGSGMPSRSEIINNHRKNCSLCRESIWTECTHCNGTGKAS